MCCIDRLRSQPKAAGREPFFLESGYAIVPSDKYFLAQRTVYEGKWTDLFMEE